MLGVNKPWSKYLKQEKIEIPVLIVDLDVANALLALIE
jgi:hypothetical protein